MKDRLHAAHVEAAAFYRRELDGRPRGWAAEHLRDRGLGALLRSDSEWRVGYAPDAWSRTTLHLRKAGFDDAEIVASGLAFVSSTGYLVDRFRGRIMFAAYDQQLRPAGFVGRASGNRKRYLNTRQTEIYSKSRTLVGLDAQLERLHAGAVPVFVEGVMDAPAVSFVGDEWAGLSACGTAITPEQATIVRGHSLTRTVVVALDGDLGGRTGAVRSLPVLSKVFDEVLFAELPDKQDPAGLHAADGGLLPKALTSTRPLVDYVIEVELSKWTNVLDHLSGQVNAVRAVAPLVTSLPPRRVARAIARLASAVHLDEQVVSHEIIASLDRRKDSRSRGRRSADAHDLEVASPDDSRSP